MSRKWRNWYQNEVDEEINGADSRDKVKHNERSDQLFLERTMKVVALTLHPCRMSSTKLRMETLRVEGNQQIM